MTSAPERSHIRLTVLRPGEIVAPITSEHVAMGALAQVGSAGS